MIVPLRLPTGKRIELTPGGQNVLVEQIIHESCPRFAPGGKPIYIGDTGDKYAFFDKGSGFWDHMNEISPFAVPLNKYVRGEIAQQQNWRTRIEWIVTGTFGTFET